MAATPSTPPPPKIGRFRWGICALLFVATLINYLDRHMLGVLKPMLTQTFHWSEQDYSKIIVAFQAAYAIGQLLAGPFVEWIGTRSAYAAAVVFWSLATMVHSLARSAFGFGAARFALGLGESANWPVAIRTVTEWFPQRERSVATGIFNTGSNVGAILGPLLVPWLVLQFGWQTAVVILGASGFIWLAVWLIVYDPPEKSRRLTTGELAYIQSGPEELRVEKMSWVDMLRYRQAWAYVVTGLVTAPVWWFYLYWLPDIFHKQFGLNLREFGPPLAVVYAVTCFGGIAGAGLSAWLLRRGWSVNWARKTAMLVCACCTVPVIFATHTRHLWLATSFFALAAAANQGWSATMFTVVSDMFPREAVASVVGLGGGIASIAAMFFSLYVGNVLQNTGAYDKILVVCGSAYVITWLIFHLMVPQIKPVDIKTPA